MAPAATVVNENNIVLDRKPNKNESPATRLRHNLENGAGLIVCPGVYDGLSARIALDVGFDALYMVRPFHSLFPFHIATQYNLRR
jgi:hypothetical protein